MIDKCPVHYLFEEYLLEEFCLGLKGADTMSQRLCYALLMKAFGNPTSYNFDFFLSAFLAPAEAVMETALLESRGD